MTEREIFIHFLFIIRAAYLLSEREGLLGWVVVWSGAYSFDKNAHFLIG
jgi:hypothetical protein